MAYIGYARVSTEDQTLDLQMDALTAAGCITIYAEHASGARQARPELANALKACRDHEHDCLLVWKLDRLGRNLSHLVEIVKSLQDRGIGFKVLTGVEVETETAHGTLMFHMFAALAEYERSLARERVMAGLAAARARGKKGGRRPKLSPAQQRQAQTLHKGGMPITEIAKTLSCSRHTIYAALRQGQAVAVAF